MGRLFLMLVMGLGLTACGSFGTNGEDRMKTVQVPSKTTEDRVEILYFHGKQRCATCRAIEKNAREAVESRFSDELKNGSLVFRSIDISKKENEKEAEKYEVTWSSLFISKWENGREHYENLTEYAFANARKDPDTFKNGIIGKIEALLK